MIGSKRKLRADIGRWRQSGWVTPEGETAILAEIDARGSSLKLASVLSILGVVLIGFAAMSFVAANWQDIPRLVRFGILLVGLWGAYLTAGALFARGMTAFAHAAVLLGICLFGASIMLIAQMYHMDGNPPDAVLTWWLGALLAGVLLQSNPALALAMLLVGLWSGWETAQSEAVHWPFLLGWGAVTAAIAWRHWRTGYYLAGAVMSIWIILLGYLLHGGHWHGLVLAIGLVAAAIAAVILSQRETVSGQPAQLAGLNLPASSESAQMIAGIVLEFAVIVSFAALLALQFFEKQDLSTFVILALVSLGLLITLIIAGLRTHNTRLVRLGYAGFSIEVLAIYFKTIGSLLGSSLFFLLTGLLVLALGWAAFKLRARNEKSSEVPQ